MKKKYRLLKNRDFKKVLNKRKVLKSKEFSIFFFKNDFENSRFGITVSSKIGNSVERHKIKRQIYSMIHENDKIDKNKIFDYVIIVRDSYKENNYEKNKEVLYNLLKGVK